MTEEDCDALKESNLFTIGISNVNASKLFPDLFSSFLLIIMGSGGWLGGGSSFLSITSCGILFHSFQSPRGVGGGE